MAVLYYENYKKFIIFIIYSFILTMLIAQNAVGLKIGDKLGDVLNTDIKVYINDVQIVGYNIDGDTYVVAENLTNYGFKVTWNGNDRSLSITKGSEIGNFKYIYDNRNKVGSVAFPNVY